ncbi:MAG: sensor domain-containing diguanylate cyclase [Proteobacteria bacterium]|nr:sensor domain-containing diguanylate cyclase [Pseudomonadota bacterium]
MDALYKFHRELSRTFATSEALLAHALSLFSGYLPVDRLSAFHLEAAERVLSLKLCLEGELRQELEEEIHLLDGSPLAQLIEGKRDHLAFTMPHPILYVPLRAPAAPAGAPFGVLRLERLSKRVFSPEHRATAISLTEELSRNLHQVELAERSGRQLKRLEALTELTAIFASSLRVDDGLKLILQGIQRHFSLDRVRLYLVDRAAKKLRGELAVDMRGGVRSLRNEEMQLVPGEHRFVDLVLRSAVDPMIERYQQTVLHVPLMVQGAGIGLLVIDNLISQEPIDPEDVDLLKSFAGQIALAVDNSRLFDEVQALSLYDSLTGLPVRRYFMQRFNEEIYRAQRSGQAMCLAIIDLDYFKGINDTYGHQVGDQVLQEVGRLIMANLRKIDFPCRYGGDEIVLLLPQCGEEDALKIMTRLAQEVRTVHVPVPFSSAREVHVTSSIGIAAYPSDGRTIEDLIQKADEALYWVKSKGRDGVSTFARTKLAAAPEAPAAPA